MLYVHAIIIAYSSHVEWEGKLSFLWPLLLFFMAIYKNLEKI